MRVCSLPTAAMLMAASLGQQTNSDSNLVIKSSVGEVLLEVVVHDSHGHLVRKIDPAEVALYVYQIDLGVTRLLWVGRERTVKSVQGFFTVIGDEIASKIVFVCSDMWEPYLKVIREKCSEALHILDRFHIVAKMNKALDGVRAAESRRMHSDGRTPVLKKSRWLLLKREENLIDEQRFRLRDLLRYNLKTVRAYLLKESFQQLWDYASPTWAGKFLDEWCRQHAVPY